MKKELPPIDLSDEVDIKTLTPEELAMVEPVGKLRWNCSEFGCMRGTYVVDYGIAPIYYWRKRWINLEHLIFFCGKHWKLYRKHLKRKPRE